MIIKHHNDHLLDSALIARAFNPNFKVEEKKEGKLSKIILILTSLYFLFHILVWISRS